MSRVISRNHKKVIWQCIDWKFLIKYIVYLKSRLYKAFLDKSKKKIYQFQSLLIDSQIFIIVAFKNSVNSCKLQANSFEIGYIIFCLYNAIDIDCQFFYFYRQKYIADLYVVVEDLIDDIKYTIINWLLEPYMNYLCYVNNLRYSCFHSLDSLSYVSYQKYDLNVYALYLNLRFCISYIDLSTLLDKLDLIHLVKVYCFKFLGTGLFSTLLFYLDSFVKYKIIKKGGNTLFMNLLNIFILQICYEMISMCIGNIENIILVSYLLDLVVISRKPYNLKVWKNNLNNFLMCNGLNIENNKSIFYVSLLHGIDCNHIFITSGQYCYPFYYMIKPSLYNQFNLIKQVSTILIQSKSQPIFLLIIRLNMLLLIWSGNYLNQPVKKICYLIDYLIHLKCQLFLKKALNKSLVRIKIYSYYSSILYLNYWVKNANNSIMVLIKSIKLYKYYFLVKLSWLYKLKCQINLREAI